MTKNTFSILPLFLLVALSASAQDTMQSIFDPKGELTWLGLDLTHAKLIGDRERWGSVSDVQRFMEAWNDLLIKEKDKYDIERALDKNPGTVKSKVEVTKEQNANLDVTEFFSNEKTDHLRLRRSDIDELISQYDFKGSTGAGLMFNVESFNKLDEEGAIWVTFVNMETKQVLFSERMIGKPGGFGLRNFWAGAVYDVITKMKKKEFEMWRKKYYRK